MSKVYKAQWPLADSTGKRQVLIYEADADDPTWYYLDATPKLRAQLFRNKYIRVFFKGDIDEDVNIDEFVRKGEWL